MASVAAGHAIPVNIFLRGWTRSLESKITTAAKPGYSEIKNYLENEFGQRFAFHYCVDF